MYCCASSSSSPLPSCCSGQVSNEFFPGHKSFMAFVECFQILASLLYHSSASSLLHAINRCRFNEIGDLVTYFLNSCRGKELSVVDSADGCPGASGGGGGDCPGADGGRW
eukprot:GEZU01011611.1.p2 GENE.GEZU01011611.1~~GEZU01011611.1.p2  ORF type:complete len:110 (+),score=4.02 GEZU01011611.1:36-365(+)